MDKIEYWVQIIREYILNNNLNVDKATFLTIVIGQILVCITKISTFLILCDLAVCLATLYVSFSLVFALMRYLQGKVFLIRFYSPTTLSSSRAEFRLPSRLACA
jgi:cellulose synthase/poly-beta-1,6-N-acetylglucosamine synthase-like glycosyltransferase